MTGLTNPEFEDLLGSPSLLNNNFAPKSMNLKKSDNKEKHTRNCSFGVYPCDCVNVESVIE